MKKSQAYKAVTMTSNSEDEGFDCLARLLREAHVPQDEILGNLGLFMPSKHLSRIMFFYEMYKRIVNTHGVICEFGVRWGQNLSLMISLRSIFEPFNRHRKVIGFDTFEGLSGVSENDGLSGRCVDGDYTVPQGYEQILEKILASQEAINPMEHIRRFELVKGDAVQTVPQYIRDHPETLVSLAIFDFDIYKPTKAAIEAIKPRLFKGSVLVFDELADDVHPGETMAVMEVLGLNNLRIQRLPMTSRVSYAVME
ncbi:crotonobetainyl-CoA--carnitine CoA-transferase [Planctomycetota bacterium]